MIIGSVHSMSDQIGIGIYIFIMSRGGRARRNRYYYVSIWIWQEARSGENVVFPSDLCLFLLGFVWIRDSGDGKKNFQGEKIRKYCGDEAEFICISVFLSFSF